MFTPNVAGTVAVGVVISGTSIEAVEAAGA